MPYGHPLNDLPEEDRSEQLRAVQNRLLKLPEFDLPKILEENVVLVVDEPLFADYGRPDGC